ncbi:jg15378 [Pararge aegeria aegeria]|uniref:Jg15378 protein n=1 Tax=Pararge aegeria aegeria TaxID=348720 RepID=A0A8S4S5C9_9NEOP|nr:jg15378 [Pararge aegeria aegeria]
MRLVAALILLTLSLNVVKTDVQLLYRAAKLYRLQRASGCKANIIYDKVLLKKVTLTAKYIFTGKVYHVQSRTGDGTRLYKVIISRVLKGDLNDVGVGVKFGKAESLRFSDATVLVHSSKNIKCPPLRVRTYAIFLTVRNRDDSSLGLNLVMEPVLLTLRNIDIIEAAIKDRPSGADLLFLGKYLPRVFNAAYSACGSGSPGCHIDRLRFIVIPLSRSPPPTDEV